MPLVLSIPPDILSFTSLLKREDILRMGYMWGCKKLIKMGRVAKKRRVVTSWGYGKFVKKKLPKIERNKETERNTKI